MLDCEDMDTELKISEDFPKNCVICSSEVIWTSGAENQSALDVLCRCFRTEPEISERVLGFRDEGPWYCESCQKQVYQVSLILAEIENFERQLQKFKETFQFSMTKCFKEDDLSPVNTVRQYLIESIESRESTIKSQRSIVRKRQRVGPPETSSVPKFGKIGDGKFRENGSSPSENLLENNTGVDVPNLRHRSLRPRNLATFSKLSSILQEEKSGESDSASSCYKPSEESAEEDIGDYEEDADAGANSEVHDNSLKERKRHECPQCHRKFTKPSKLRAHKNRWHPEKGSAECFPCPQCTHMFKSSEKLQAHILRAHQGISKPYKCPHCEKSYRHQLHLDDHLQTFHSSIKGNFNCTLCPKKFISERKLRLHSANAHNSGEDLPFACEQCPKKFAKVYYLENHIYQHTGEKRFICEICGRAYFSHQRLKAHLQDHERAQPVRFPCEHCEKTFTEENSMRMHMSSVHEKTFRFHCEVCGAGAQRLSMLKRHMVCHSEEKTFACDVCEKKFKRKPQLDQHKLLHEGKLPYMCPQCGKGFRASEKLKNHEKLHTGEKPFACEICGTSYALKHYLTNHVNTVHKGKRQRKRTEGPKRQGHSTARIQNLSRISGEDLETKMDGQPGPDKDSGKLSGENVPHNLSQFPEVNSGWAQFASVP